MTLTPTITTTRLSLRSLTKASPLQTSWLRDPEIVRYSEQRHRTHTLSSQLRYISSFGGQSRIWGIYFAETGAHIGNITATHDEPNNVSEIGIMIGEQEFWRKGLAGEAWRAVCEWMLDRNYGRARKLEAGCMRSNEAMLRILRSSRFTEEGERLNHFLLDGAPVGMVLFGRMK